MSKNKDKDLLVRCFFEIEDVEVREDENGKKKLVGYAARFESLSVPMWGMREKIRSGAFKNSIEKNKIVALWNHNTDLVLGNTRAKTLVLSEDDKGLRFELDPPETQTGKDAVISVKRKDVDGMSFGFKPIRQEWDEKDPKNVVRTLVEVDLREISFTAFPAYQATSVSVRSIADDYSDWRNEQGKSQSEINESNLKLMLRKIEAL